MTKARETVHCIMHNAGHSAQRHRYRIILSPDSVHQQFQAP